MFESLRLGKKFVQLKYLNSQKMTTSTKSLHMGISKFIQLNKVAFISDFGSTFSKSPCLGTVQLRPAYVSLILWSYTGYFKKMYPI